MPTDTVQQLDALLKDQPQVPMRPNQVADFQEERDRLRSVATAPAWQSGADRGAATKRFRQIDKMLQEQAPKPLDSARQDKVAKLVDDLSNELRDTLLPQSVMRRNPAGAVDAFRRGEGSKQTKHKILTWKRALRALDPTNDDIDYTNVEKLRPSGLNTDGTSTFMADAQIPGKFAMTPRAKENWPLGDPTADTAIAQVQKREKAELTDEQKQKRAASLAKARETLAAKRAAASQPAVDLVAAPVPTPTDSTSPHDVPADEVTE